jgi:hypothetical protein
MPAFGCSLLPRLIQPGCCLHGAYDEQGDHKFRLTSPSPALVKLLRITALDRKLLGVTGPKSQDGFLPPYRHHTVQNLIEAPDCT